MVYAKREISVKRFQPLIFRFRHSPLTTGSSARTGTKNRITFVAFLPAVFFRMSSLETSLPVRDCCAAVERWMHVLL